MRDKEDDLERKKTIFEKSDETKKDAMELKPGREDGLSSEKLATGDEEAVPPKMTDAPFGKADIEVTPAESDSAKDSQGEAKGFQGAKDQEASPVILPQLSEEMEVLLAGDKESTELSHSTEGKKAVSKWAFWKRPSQRDEQLARISDGYLEMVDLVRAIRTQLESQNENNIILRDSLTHLPDTMKGLESFSKSQHVVGDALQEIHGQMLRAGERDSKLGESMDGFNSTLQGMDVTNQATMKTFDQVQERMRESDTRMENLFEDVQETEVKVSDTMVKLQKNMAIMQGVFLFCLLVVIGVLIFFVMESREKSPIPAASGVTQPEEVRGLPTGVAPGRSGQVEIPLGND